jgi:hypothetical protein
VSGFPPQLDQGGEREKLNPENIPWLCGIFGHFITSRLLVIFTGNTLKNGRDELSGLGWL